MGRYSVLEVHTVLCNIFCDFVVIIRFFNNNSVLLHTQKKIKLTNTNHKLLN